MEKETIDKLVDGFHFRINLSDTVKCHEDGCLEPGLPCYYTIGKDKDGNPVEDVHYYCPLHGIANGYCETCGQYDETMGRDNRTQCLPCIQEARDHNLDPDNFNNFGVGNPDEPNQPSIQ